MAGTSGAFLDHTQSSVAWHDYYINGEKYGEIGQWVAVAGHFNVPLLFVSGDRAACDEAVRQFPGVETVAVKEAIARNRARITLPPQRAHEAIRAGACRSLGLVGKLKPWRIAPPAEIKIEFNRADYAEGVAFKEDVERLDARTVRKVVTDMRLVMHF
jgi:D-amino peptidase